MADIRGKLREMLTEHFGPAAVEGLANDTKMWAQVPQNGFGVTGELDSLDKVEFLMGVEEEFQIDIPDSLAQQMHSIDDIANYLDRILASRGTSGS